MKLIPLVHVHPNPSGLPGGHVIQQLLDGLAGWALFGSLAALLISAIVWALGSQQRQLPRARAEARPASWSPPRRLSSSAPHPRLINFFNHLGQSV